MFSPLFVMLVN